ncbi:MAG TPA: FISUMP domain-containing protein [Blastocatellia bacterium]|nr:FISUMP domain-containing protein [Blastocatellia bacterium]
MIIAVYKINFILVCFIALVLCIALGSVSASLERDHQQDQKASRTTDFFKQMADSKQWTTQNLNVNTTGSYCYQDSEQNCRQYGRLYTWDSALQVCKSLGDGWRLPTDDEWRQLAKHYGGMHDDAEDGGKAAYKALLSGGSSGFNAMLGGGRAVDGEFARLCAHGFYWTASESDPATAVFYNFGHGNLALYRQDGGEKQRAFSVRCVRDDK